MNVTRTQTVPSKRICILAHSLDEKRGGGRFLTAIIRHLLGTYDVEVLTALPSGSQLENPILSHNPFVLLLRLGKIRRVLARADIVHAFDVHPYGIIAGIAGIGLRKKFVLTAVGSSSIQPLYRFGLATLSQWVYRKADVLTAVSGYVAREIRKKLPYLDFTIITPGIDFNYFLNVPTSNIVPRRPFILSVAKVKPRKGVLVSVRAFARIAEEFPELDYIIVGVHGGSYFEKIQALIQTLGLTDRIFFKERVSDAELVALYRNAQLFILLPQNIDNDIEGFGLVFLEAAAFGLPVIGAEDSGAEDAIRAGRNGYLVAPHDSVEAAERMRDILRNPTLRESFSKESVTFAKHSDWRIIMRQYNELYGRLLKH